MNANTIRDEVQAFRERTAFGSSTPHCFTPWYLHKSFELSETQAMTQFSDGSYDYGIDGFHLDGGELPSSLVLIQAKYTSSLTQISSGLRELEKGLPELAKAFDRIGSDLPIENAVLVNLRAALNKLPENVLRGLRFEFHLVHMNEEDAAVVRQKTSAARSRLREAVEKYFPERTVKIREVGPGDLGEAEDFIKPPEEALLSLNVVQAFGVGTDVKMYSGIGKLADLVELYRLRRDHLFSKNVRYFINKRKNREKGPAGKMRETLKRICVEKKLAPETFALFHNGVTIHVAGTRESAGAVHVRNAFVLNGCQTIKNAFFFLHDPNLKHRVDEQLWQRVALPIRVVEARDDVLVRSVTVNNNHQNQITFAALRANDPVQLRLEERLRQKKIFYDRQEGAYDNLEADAPELIDSDYYNSDKGPVRMVDLARAVAAVAGEISLADHPAELFESDTAYARCFDEDARLGSVAFLVFLYNVQSVIGTVLMRDLGLSRIAAGPRPSRLKYYALCFLVRYLAREKMRGEVAKWGTSVAGKSKGLRDWVATVLRSKKSGIKDELYRSFIKLETSDQGSLKAAFEQAEHALKLKKTCDPFTIFCELDEQAEFDELDAESR